MAHRTRIPIILGLITISIISVGSSLPGAQGASMFPNIPNCPVAKRFENWNAVVQNSVSFHEFTATWSDVLTKNSCQQADIFLIHELTDQAQEQLRKKIFSCQTKGITELVAKIRDLQFELEYVRHVIDTDDEKPAPEGNKALVRSPEKIRQLLQKSVVVERKLISGERFEKLFLEFEKKYADRLDAYINCKSSWNELTDAWNDFADSWGGLAPAWKKLKKNTESKAQALNSPAGRSGEFLDGFLDVKMNGLKPQQGLSAIAQQLQRNSSSGASPDFQQLLSTAENDLGRFNLEQERIERRTRYETLYKEFGDLAASEMLKEIINMNAVIDSTLLNITPNIQKCTAKIAARQCGGK